MFTQILKTAGIVVALVLLIAPLSFIYNHQVHSLARLKNQINIDLSRDSAKAIMSNYCQRHSSSLMECSLQFEVMLISENCSFNTCTLSVATTSDDQVSKVSYLVE